MITLPRTRNGPLAPPVAVSYESTMQFRGLDAQAAATFCDRWLPAWVWTHRGSIPMPDGFLNEWHASIPVGSKTIEVDGVCTVQLRGGLIYRNMVYFDRSELLRVLAGATRL